MKVDLLIHLKTTDDVIFNRMHPCFIENDPAFIRAHDTQDSRQVKRSVVRSGKIRITQKVVHAVGIQFA